MSRLTKTVLTGAACALLVSVGEVPALAQADDQSRLDTAIDAFEQRLTEAGWVGEPTESDDADEVEDDDDVTVADDEFNQCFGELAVFFESSGDDEFPGQTALRESMEFTYLPEGVPATTEESSFDLGAEETATAFAVSVDDSGVELLDSFVDTIGAKETGDCMREAIEAEMETSSTDEEIATEIDFTVENEADLGVGDRSAWLQFGFDMSFMGMALLFDVNLYVARADHDLVMVIHSTFGDVETMSTLDAVAELQTLVDSL